MNVIDLPHGRVAAAKQLGLAEVPTIELSHLSPNERRAYVIADNRLAELAGWDRDILKIEFQSLADMDLDFELETIGFETAELDLLLDDSSDEDADPADDMPLPKPGPAITQQGDIWLLGSHRLICGDARSPETYAALMEDDRAQAVFSNEKVCRLEREPCDPIEPRPQAIPRRHNEFRA
jgi:ParB-like chromosome segregation protein Spo0J